MCFNISILVGDVGRMLTYHSQSPSFSVSCMNWLWWPRPGTPALWKMQAGGLGVQSHL